MSEKSVFKFLMPDGSVGNMESLKNKACSLKNDFVTQRQQEYEAFLTSEMYNERIWRDQELALTDKLMFEDATYNGSKVYRSDFYQAILDYRQQLRDYDLKYQPRPERPAWFKG